VRLEELKKELRLLKLGDSKTMCVFQPQSYLAVSTN
jgi:hypothetical protein